MVCMSQFTVRSPPTTHHTFRVYGCVRSVPPPHAVRAAHVPVGFVTAYFSVLLRLRWLRFLRLLVLQRSFALYTLVFAFLRFCVFVRAFGLCGYGWFWLPPFTYILLSFLRSFVAFVLLRCCCYVLPLRLRLCKTLRFICRVADYTLRYRYHIHTTTFFTALPPPPALTYCHPTTLRYSPHHHRHATTFMQFPTALHTPPSPVLLRYWFLTAVTFVWFFSFSLNFIYLHWFCCLRVPRISLLRVQFRLPPPYRVRSDARSLRVLRSCHIPRYHHAHYYRAFYHILPVTYHVPATALPPVHAFRGAVPVPVRSTPPRSV